jgi:translation elongation factor EF-4
LRRTHGIRGQCAIGRAFVANGDGIREHHNVSPRIFVEAMGKQPKLSEKQQKESRRMHGIGKYSISNVRPTPVGIKSCERRI